MRGSRDTLGKTGLLAALDCVLKHGLEHRLLILTFQRAVFNLLRHYMKA